MPARSRYFPIMGAETQKLQGRDAARVLALGFPRLTAVDGRTRDGRFLRDYRAELVAHVGGRPSATQAALIDRAAWLALRVQRMDTLDGQVADISERAGRDYLAWNAALARLLTQLGMQPSTITALAAEQSSPAPQEA